MHENDPYELQQLTLDRIKLSRSPGGMLKGVIDGLVYRELLLCRTFPLQQPDRYISVRDSEGKEIGVIEDPLQLDEESQYELESELRKRYFLPRVKRIQSVRQKNDIWIWELETDAGEMRISMSNLHDHVQFQSNHRILLTDISGRRCEITDSERLDSKSRLLLRDVL